MGVSGKKIKMATKRSVKATATILNDWSLPYAPRAKLMTTPIWPAKTKVPHNAPRTLKNDTSFSKHFTELFQLFLLTYHQQFPRNKIGTTNRLHHWKHLELVWQITNKSHFVPMISGPKTRLWVVSMKWTTTFDQFYLQQRRITMNPWKFQLAILMWSKSILQR